jgi:hypothetical protein
MIGGVAVLAVLALVLLVIVLVRGPDDGTASGSATPTPSPTSSASPSAPASASATPSASPGAPTPSPQLPAIAPDAVVATTVEGLTVRESPGLDGERLGTLAGGALSFVAGGPTDADGFRWYLVSGLGLPPNSGCAGPFETDPFNCPIWFGWIAAASESGEPWLVEHDIACPQDRLTVENLAVGRTALERLACFGAEPITFRGYWPEIPDSGLGGACLADQEPSGWLLCQNINYNRVAVDDEEGWSGIALRVSVDPATDVTLPEPETWVEVTAHLDDSAAQGCDEAAEAFEEPDRPPEQYVLDCRVELVVEQMVAVEGP